MVKNDPLLQPFQLKRLRIKNRIFSASHEPAYSEGGKPGERYRLYHEEKAKGGMGMTMFGGSSLVAKDSPAVFGNLYIGDDDILPSLRLLADRVHKHDCALMCQITHLGRRSVWHSGHWLPTVSASCVREPVHRAFPKEMEDWDIQRVTRNYAEGARRCVDGGLDGVELLANGHLLDCFWSPRTNLRQDEYGGDTAENRMRFSLGVLSAVRKAVGDDFIVGIRMGLDETVEDGFGFEEGLRIARTIIETGHVDFVNVVRGHIDTDEGLSHIIPNMGTVAAPNLEFTGKVRAELGGIPVFHAGRINDVATARHAIREGMVDMVGMVRAHITDPHITTKIERGEEHRIRPCVGAGYCIDRIYEPGDALCIHNPSTGREAELPHIITRSGGAARKVVVVGAGPGGLEAARVSAERGHQVVVFEASSEAGGQVLLASKLERRREIIGIIDWRLSELEHLGVTIHYQRLATAAEVLEQNPDVVIIATGGLPNTDLCPGAEHLISTWDILSGQVAPAAEVLLFDDSGQHASMSCAEYIALKGSRLEIVTPERMIARDVGDSNYPAYYRVFFDHDVRTTTCQRLLSVTPANGKLLARFRNDFNRQEIERSADQIIAEHGTLPCADLYLELKPASSNLGELDYEALTGGAPQQIQNNPDGHYQLFRIGDAVSSRNIHAALLDAIRLCKDF